MGAVDKLQEEIGKASINYWSINKGRHDHFKLLILIDQDSRTVPSFIVIGHKDIINLER